MAFTPKWSTLINVLVLSVYFLILSTHTKHGQCRHMDLCAIPFFGPYFSSQPLDLCILLLFGFGCLFRTDNRGNMCNYTLSITSFNLKYILCVQYICLHCSGLHNFPLVLLKELCKDAVVSLNHPLSLFQPPVIFCNDLIHLHNLWPLHA